MCGLELGPIPAILQVRCGRDVAGWKACMMHSSVQDLPAHVSDPLRSCQRYEGREHVLGLPVELGRHDVVKVDQGSLLALLKKQLMSWMKMSQSYDEAVCRNLMECFEGISDLRFLLFWPTYKRSIC